MNGLRATNELAKREFIRQIRQPTRIVASIVTPLLIWVFLIGGFSRSIGSVSGTDSTIGPYTIPGIASLTVLFSSIFASISLIQDRHDGFLRAALISPTPRWTIAISKIYAGSIIALAQGAVVLLTLPVSGVPIQLTGFLGALLVLCCVSIALIGLGLALAWIVDSTQGFHGIMNSILMPLWITSAAIFPVNEAAGWLKWVALFNPLTWTHEAMRNSLGMESSLSPTMAWTVSILSAIFGIALSAHTLGKISSNR